jgi:DNA-binding response OmpR family regulator
MRNLLIWALVDGGYDVDAVADGTSLCHHLGKHLTAPGRGRIDLVVSDIRMPGITGLEVIRGLHEIENLPPTILITAFGDAEIHREANEIGVTLLDKPFEIDELMAQVGQILPSRGGAS